MDDDEILPHLRAQGDKKREHAAFFDWHDRSAFGKGVAESGIVDELLEAMQAQGRRDYRNLGASGEEWLDVWLHNVPVMLTDVTFITPSTIGRVFFLLSYDPNRGGYRYFELQLAAYKRLKLAGPALKGTVRLCANEFVPQGGALASTGARPAA